MALDKAAKSTHLVPIDVHNVEYKILFFVCVPSSAARILVLLSLFSVPPNEVREYIFVFN